MSAAGPALRPPTAERFRIAGFSAILAIAALRALVGIVPEVWFDVDPARDAMPQLALSGAGSMLLDALACLAAFVALVGEHFSGRGVRLPLVALATAPAALVWWHGSHDLLDAFRGDTWVAAALAFAALAHLVRDGRLRVVAIAVLAAVAVPLAVRGIAQVTVEHEATVEAYRATREQFLADRGWAPDSSAARTYERRLMQAEATGWFGLANPYSTFLGVGVVGLGLLGALAWRAASRSVGALGLVGALACGGLLVVNGGKGALLATGAALAVALASFAWKRPARGNWVLLLACGAVAAVAVRGLLGDASGELSLLFRAHYLETGARIVAESPFAGVGPAGVQEAFARLKPVECPEDVTSLHSLFVDWIAALGVVGLAWVALVAWSLRGAPGVASCEAATRDALDPSRLALRIAGIAAILALLVARVVEAPALDATALVLRAAGLVGFVLVAAAMAQAGAELVATARGRLVAAAGVAVAAIVLVHSMIEVTAWIPGGALLALSCVALASAVPEGGSRIGAARMALVLPLAAALVVNADRAAANRVASGLSLAAREVRPLVELRGAVREYLAAEPSRRDAAAVLAAAEALPAVSSVDSASSVFPADRTPDRLAPLRASLAAGDGAGVRAAAAGLDRLAREACVAWLVGLADDEPRSATALAAAIEQRSALALRATGPASVAIADDRAFALARALADRFVREHPGSRSIALRADLALIALRGGLAADPAERTRIEGAIRSVVEMQPSNPRRWRDLGMALSQLGDAQAAQDALRRALEASARTSRHDPLAGLSGREVLEIESMLASSSTSPAAR